MGWRGVEIPLGPYRCETYRGPACLRRDYIASGRATSPGRARSGGSKAPGKQTVVHSDSIAASISAGLTPRHCSAAGKAAAAGAAGALAPWVLPPAHQ
jgi:hypothetical protein